jgi:ATP-dependent protease HslVU (ClpYQ) peptidase subunit
MTVIAWKDGVIAADRQVNSGHLVRLGKKLFREGNSVLGFTGPNDFGLAMVRWKRQGGSPTDFPSCQSNPDYAVLVEASYRGVFIYYQTADAVEQRQPFWAIGQGAELAIGAMAAGATADQAVDIACQFSSSCGLGVDKEYYK